MKTIKVKLSMSDRLGYYYIWLWNASDDEVLENHNENVLAMAKDGHDEEDRLRLQLSSNEIKRRMIEK